MIDRRLLLGGGAGWLAATALPALAKRKPLVAALDFVDVRDHGAKGDGLWITLTCAALALVPHIASVIHIMTQKPA